MVWLSRAGREWSPVAVPALRPGETVGVAASDDDLVVAMSPRMGNPIVVVRDIRSVIARATG